MLQSPTDLHGQLVVQAIDQVTRVVRHVADMESHAAPVAGIHHLLQIVEDLDDGLVLGQRAMPQMVDAAHFGVGGHDAIGQVGQLFFQAEVGSHSWYSWPLYVYSACAGRQVEEVW